MDISAQLLNRLIALIITAAQILTSVHSTTKFWSAQLTFPWMGNSGNAGNQASTDKIVDSSFFLRLLRLPQLLYIRKVIVDIQLKVIM
jgi:hypothetical protein